ncbi:MAG: tRNA 2-thiouridine(34) synthase MnmA, partial [Patescibacteria group bacterium]|nr:tRNA 2-thiouridine(34) synthase MnmA [Patescibacteria group bacterium]
MADRRKSAIIAISGGVDSAVAAQLLKKQNYSLIGLYMRLIPGQEKSESMARALCQSLNIPFYPVNLKNKFYNEIIRYFLDSYQAGDTPNPCVRCNRMIKFQELMRLREELGANYLATGHYVIRGQKAKNKKQKNIQSLFMGKDQDKDQSYFLYTLTQDQLEHSLFPIGEYTKNIVRKIADKNRLPYLKKESQDVCFLNQNGKILEHNRYLKARLKLAPGPIKTLENKKIGKHQGLPLYTIGQRRGIEIGGTGPYYAVRADNKANILYVADNANDPALFSDELIASELNWISGVEPKLPLKCKAA